jgi:hypothetical protein
MNSFFSAPPSFVNAPFHHRDLLNGVVDDKARNIAKQQFTL